MPRRLLVAAGPNGSGKSTIFNRAKLHPLFPPFFVSPDEEAKKEPFNLIEDELQRYIAAMTYCEDLRNVLMSINQDLAFETVFSTGEKLEFLRKAKDNGYNIEVIYVTTKDPLINIARVAERVSEGGHNVPTDKLLDRYEKSMSYLPEIFELSDNLAVYDNSENKPFIVLFKDSKRVNLLNSELAHPWLEDRLLSKVRQKYNIPEYKLSSSDTSNFIQSHMSKTVGMMSFF